MKLNKFFTIALASLCVLASCKKDEDNLGEASLTINGETSYTVGTDAGSVEVSFVATRDWTAKHTADWLSVDPESGSGSSKAQKISITVLPNDSYARSAEIKLSIGTSNKTIKISQDGASAPDGTKDNPFDVATAVAKCVEIGQTQSTEKYYVKGIVSAMKNVSGIAQYGNVDFYITADGAASDTKLLVFQCLYLGGAKFTSEDQIKVGDEVIVYGPLVNYMGNTPETGGKGSTCLVKLNDKEEDAGGGSDATGVAKGTGTESDPFNATAAIKKAQEAGQTATAEQYYIKGIISSFRDTFNPTYGNMSFNISDDGTKDGDQFYIFRVLSYDGAKFVSADQLKVGDEVVVLASVVNYMGNTPETSQGGRLISVNGGQEASEYLTLSAKQETVSSAAGSISLDITSNQSWTVASNADFATVSPASGSNDGTVTVTYTENTGDTRTAVITVTAANGKVASFTLTQNDKNTKPAVEITWVASDWTSVTGGITMTKNGYTVTMVKAASSSNPPAYHEKSGSVRAYAGATVTIEGPSMKAIDFELADNYRTPAITADCGAVAPQSLEAAFVSWTGESAKVVFTVGDKAIYGSDGETKAGQFRIASITIQ